MDNRLVHRDDNVTYRASAEHSFFDDRCFEKTWHKAILGEVNLALIRRLKPSKLSGKQNFLRANPSQQTPRTYEAPINKKQGFKGIKKRGSRNVQVLGSLQGKMQAFFLWYQGLSKVNCGNLPLDEKGLHKRLNQGLKHGK